MIYFSIVVYNIIQFLYLVGVSLIPLHDVAMYVFL